MNRENSCESKAITEDISRKYRFTLDFHQNYATFVEVFSRKFKLERANDEGDEFRARIYFHAQVRD